MSVPVYCGCFWGCLRDLSFPAAVEFQRHVDLEKNVRVGERALVLTGVRIGKRAIVGASSVLTKHFPSYTGSPAIRVEKSNGLMRNIRSKGHLRSRVQCSPPVSGLVLSWIGLLRVRTFSS